MFVLCAVDYHDVRAWWYVWRPAFRYDVATGLARLVDGAWRPCALADLFPGVTRALGTPQSHAQGLDFGDLGGKFDDAPAAPDARRFESRFGTKGRGVRLVALHALPAGTATPPVFARGLHPDAAPLVARMPPELVFAVAEYLARIATQPGVLDLCEAVHVCAAQLSTGLKAKLDQERIRQNEIGSWHAIGYSTDPANPNMALAPRARRDASEPRSAALILATIVERKRAADVSDGLDAAALVSDRRLFWTSAVALGLLCDAKDKTPVPTVDEWFRQLVEVASDSAAEDAYY